MKRLLLILLASLLVFASFVACSDDVEQIPYGNRTQAFYAGMSEGVFWYSAQIVTSGGSTYSYSQATDGVNVTTIVDKAGTANDSYEIFHNGNDMKYIHELNISAKKYDTVITDRGQSFLFEGYNYTMFVNMIKSGEEELNGEKYYCEYFRTTDTAGGSATGYDKYYYKGDTLCAVVTPTIAIYFNEYSAEIPETVYLEAPTDFKAGSLRDEHYVDFSEAFGDISLDLE